jgi:DNA polymerase II large subunit
MCFPFQVSLAVNSFVRTDEAQGKNAKAPLNSRGIVKRNRMCEENTRDEMWVHTLPEGVWPSSYEVQPRTRNGKPPAPTVLAAMNWKISTTVGA